MGNDIFKEYNYPKKILKNNLEIVYPGKINSVGIRVKEFELISNVTAVIDENKEAVIFIKIKLISESFV